MNPPFNTKIMEIKFSNRYFAYLAISFGFLAAIACNPKPSTKYSQDLAEQYGADEYGMKRYILVILKTGPDTTSTKEELEQLFRGHMDNITRLSDQGKLVVAGPMSGKNERGYRGIFILNTNDEQEAREMLSGDPAITKGVFEAELYPWYGSAALPAYLDVHERISKTNP